ncbi:maleylacetate reductase [Cupriavidus sp. CV2]|uniref:maleylacetate reductase n=1 Tax=Cupriavidus ulmosensis TaxID=3065913 RepID=UPI00296B0EBA|nr:maleylacetate reductase [Cupriavidus sp. CV2]MDW3683733.1 maleylacetate reductase [Cupriavidus sp. CV2]
MMQDSFIYSPLPARVVFGKGSLASLAREVEQLGATRALVLCTPEQMPLARRVAELLGDRYVGTFPGAVMHVPIEVAREARALAARLGADCAVAVGGGSTIGLGKAIALESPIPIVAVPTTYAGSEMTPIYANTENGEKKTGRSAQVLPRSVVYDPELTLTLPPAISATSGLNAIAHCVEALYAADANPVTTLMAEDGIRALASGLPEVVTRPHDMAARSACLYGAWLAGSVLGTCAVALHHKLCHTLGGMLNLPHAQTHAIILPHAVQYNAAAAPHVMARIAAALGSDDAARGLHQLARRLQVPLALEQLGVRHGDLARVADQALRAPYPNPAPLTRDGILRLLENAFAGVEPH